MDLEKHIVDTVKEWQLKIGYREGSMKLYYPGDSLAMLLGLEGPVNAQVLEERLKDFCDMPKSLPGDIKISGNYERYCLDISAKGCAYVAGKIPEPVFLKRFLQVITNPGNSIVQVRECFERFAQEMGCFYEEESAHSHEGYAFFFSNPEIEEYVYWVEENEFGLNYHRFTREEYNALVE